VGAFQIARRHQRVFDSAFSILGLIVSLILSAGGIFAFCIHTAFIRKGRPEFNTPISRFILALMLGVSTIQATVTFYILFA
jgi:hypothetical protein